MCQRRFDLILKLFIPSISYFILIYFNNFWLASAPNRFEVLSNSVNLRAGIFSNVIDCLRLYFF